MYRKDHTLNIGVKPSNTFFVISNINSVHSQFTPDQRFIQTLETFASIRKMAPNSAIIFCDNSTVPLTKHQLDIIGHNVDHIMDFTNNLFTEWVNGHGRNKGLNEVIVYREMLNAALSAGLVGRRIFKISGRYRLSATFDIHLYSRPEYTGKYVFRVTPWVYNEGAGEFLKMFYNTALWSMCSSLLTEYRDLLPNIFGEMMTTGENIEVVHNRLIPKDKLVILESLGGIGHITNGEPTSI